jgi:hypothetical protein
MTESRLAPTTEGETLRDALIKAVGFDRLSEPQRELALAIAQRYNLDPMLKHLVMIEGKPYITRDGLLHVAHDSGHFDGIEVTNPTMEDGKFWRCVATVYRKDFSRPFVYPGRYPATGGNQRYAEEMAIKVAEVMCLRRAFDVSAPTVEERWDEAVIEGESIASDTAPASLTDRIASRAASLVESATVAEGLAETVVDSVDEAPVVPHVDGDIVSRPLGEAAPVGVPDLGDVEMRAGNSPDTMPRETESDPMADLVETAEEDAETEAIAAEEAPSLPTHDDLKAWAKDQPKDLVKSVARELYPDGGRFEDLTGEQRARLIAEVEARLARPTRDETVAKALDAMEGHEVERVEFCGAKSSLSDATCTLDVGHRGVHRAGLRESW